ncbi:MAG TPA: hypothetical protein PK307_12145 [Spirochaetota bacterium]|nr:hypothetical protein [Spirochaetota bacterium]HOD14875.1 hypothetical protein [Spirochaetota bacterium]HPG49299.1 hypothetical protein [Spirochaetota bacterium]HPN10725.1 hypothetical protein [Spirochaetota bacterium]HQL82947.1 hypothetical protein [Spirochaetota bacterium]
MNDSTSTYSTTCSNRKSGEILLETELKASSLEEAEDRAFATCIRAGNNYDEVRVAAKKISTGPTIH